VAAKYKIKMKWRRKSHAEDPTHHSGARMSEPVNIKSLVSVNTDNPTHTYIHTNTGH